MKTPHISVRVPTEKLEDWREACRRNDTDVSNQIRKLMDAWVAVDALNASMDDSEASEDVFSRLLELDLT